MLDGPIGTMMRVFGIHRSPQNPNICNRCSTHIAEGSIVELTILFADLVGFTSMTNEIGAQRSFEIVNEVLNKASQILIRHDAFVDKYIGDAVMAMFNVPIRRDDHVVQAVSAGMEIGSSLREFENRFGRKLRCRIGIATGFAHVGHLGSKERSDYTAIGEVVNLAARLEAAALPGEIVLNDAAYERVAALHPTAMVQSIMVKGFDSAITIARISPPGKNPQAQGAAGALSSTTFRRRLTLGSTIFALFGAPCVGAAVLGPLAVAVGAGAFFTALLPVLQLLDTPAVQYPLFFLASAGAAVNLFVIGYGYKQRKKGGILRQTLPRFERIKTVVVASASVLAILLIAIELFLHLFLGHHLYG